MEELLSKRRAAAMRGFPDMTCDATQNNAEWSAVEEGFRLLERDLGKLQVTILQPYNLHFPHLSHSNLLRSMPSDSERSSRSSTRGLSLRRKNFTSLVKWMFNQSSIDKYGNLCPS